MESSVKIDRYLLSTQARSTILARRTAWLRPVSRLAGHEAVMPSSRRRPRTVSRRELPWHTHHTVVPPLGVGSSVTISRVPSWNIKTFQVKTLLQYMLQVQLHFSAFRNIVKIFGNVLQINRFDRHEQRHWSWTSLSLFLVPNHWGRYDAFLFFKYAYNYHSSVDVVYPAARYLAPHSKPSCCTAKCSATDRSGNGRPLVRPSRYHSWMAPASSQRNCSL